MLILWKYSSIFYHLEYCVFRLVVINDVKENNLIYTELWIINSHKIVKIKNPTQNTFLSTYPNEWAENYENKVSGLPWHKLYSFKILIQN